MSDLDFKLLGMLDEDIKGMFVQVLEKGNQQTYFRREPVERSHIVGPCCGR
jgi:hypothetical protein